jgi:hypothetical protein
MSISMGEVVGEVTKSDLVSQTLLGVIREIVRRSAKGSHPAPRYSIAAYAYNDEVHDVFGGPKLVTDIIKIGVPVMEPNGTTDTAKAFEKAEELLLQHSASLANCPAPLICHLTDGLYTASDPRPIVERIKKMTFPDGAVLVENVLFDKDATHEPIDDPHTWPGVTSPDQLASTYAKELYQMSSPIPDSYLANLAERGYHLQPGAKLFFPGETPEMVEAAFTASGMTSIA